MGLTGDDDFHFKVSPDGSSWVEAFRINRSTGAATMPAAPIFEAVRTAGDVASVTTLVFNNVIANVGGGYNSSTGHFIVPETGRYLFYVVGLARITGTLEVQIRVNNITRGSGRHEAVAYKTTTHATVIASLVAGDDVAVVANQGTFYGSGFTTFSGTLLG